MSHIYSFFFRLLFIVGPLFLSPSYAAQEGEWTGTGLGWKEAELQLSDTERYSQERGVLAAYHALDLIIDYVWEGEIDLRLASKNANLKSKPLFRNKYFEVVKSDGAQEGLMDLSGESDPREEELQRSISLLEILKDDSPHQIQKVFKSTLDWVLSYEPQATGNEGSVGYFLNCYFEIWFDPHTYLYPKSLMEELEEESGVSLVGIGVELSYSNQGLVIDEVVKGAPSDKGGIHAGDIIINIDGKEVQDLGVETASHLINGLPGSRVSLKILRDGVELSKNLVRDHVTFRNVIVQSYRLSPKNKVAHIRLRSFMPKTTCRDMRKALVKAPWKGIILDLRDNTGGSLAITECLMGFFLGKDKLLISLKDIHSGEIKEQSVTSRDQLTDTPTVVLINGDSASASEIVAGSFQEYDRGLVLGTRSFGKGTVQFVLDYPNHKKLSWVKTIGRFHFPSGWSNQNQGIDPDFEILPRKWSEDGFGPPTLEKFETESDYLYPVLQSSMFRKEQGDRSQRLEEIERCVQRQGDNFTIKVPPSHRKLPDFQVLQSIEYLSCMAEVGKLPLKMK